MGVEKPSAVGSRTPKNVSMGPPIGRRSSRPPLLLLRSSVVGRRRPATTEFERKGLRCPLPWFNSVRPIQRQSSNSQSASRQIPLSSHLNTHTRRLASSTFSLCHAPCMHPKIESTGRIRRPNHSTYRSIDLFTRKRTGEDGRAIAPRARERKEEGERGETPHAPRILR